MKYEYSDPKMVKLLEDRDKLVTEAREISKKIEKLEKDRATIGMKVEKIKGKAKTWVDKNVKIEAEFEEIESVSLKDGKVSVTTFDMIEEFKKNIRERRKQVEQESK